MGDQSTPIGDVLDGVRVLEVAMYLFAPAAGAVLADWGADVIKVEHATHGDPMRRTAAWGLPALVDGISYTWEVANRGKRDIGIDISTADGREIILMLAERSDVFLTNFLPTARKKLGIDVDDITARNPSIIYARGSAAGSAWPRSRAWWLRRDLVLGPIRRSRIGNTEKRRLRAQHAGSRIR